MDAKIDSNLVIYRYGTTKEAYEAGRQVAFEEAGRLLSAPLKGEIALNIYERDIFLRYSKMMWALSREVAK